MSPCVNVCKLSNGFCVGCYRTVAEIIDWREKSMCDRQKVMEQIKGQISTHDCPECQGPAYCAMEAGKSATLCWCMSEPRRESNPEVDMGDTCLCRRCLAKIGQTESA